MKGAYEKLTKTAFWMPKHPGTQYNNWQGKLARLNLFWALTKDISLKSFTENSYEWEQVERICSGQAKHDTVGVLLAGATPAQAVTILKETGARAFTEDWFFDKLLQKLEQLAKDVKA